jgi:hypothetical protein
VWDPPAGAGVAACLADETAIDFPAVIRLADGARRALGDEPDSECARAAEPIEALGAVVQLSPRAAALGAVVSCQLVMRDICPACGGRGESWSEPCPRCATAGHVVVRRRVRLAVPAGVRDGTVCRFRLLRANQSSVKVDVRIDVRPSVA